jgi:hypothetical protein
MYTICVYVCGLHVCICHNTTGSHYMIRMYVYDLRVCICHNASGSSSTNALLYHYNTTGSHYTICMYVYLTTQLTVRTQHGHSTDRQHGHSTDTARTQHGHTSHTHHRRLQNELLLSSNYCCFK